jgi:hypothetical protein
MDPSPFHERDLDDDAEEFIVSWAQEFPRRDPVSLVINVNQIPEQRDAQHLVEAAVHHYFAYRAKLNRLEFRHLLKEGRTSLIIGLVFLGACHFDQRVAATTGTQKRAHDSPRGPYHRWLGCDVAANGNLPL